MALTHGVAGVVEVLTSGGGSGSDTRITLTVATTFYVSTTGTDVPGGGTLAAPYLTWNYAYHDIINRYDFGGQIVTMTDPVGGVFSAGITFDNSWTGGGTLVVQGFLGYDGSGNYATQFNVSAGTAFLATTTLAGNVQFGEFYLLSPDAGHLSDGINISSPNIFYIGNIQFGLLNNGCLAIFPGSTIIFNNPALITDLSQVNFSTRAGGTIQLNSEIVYLASKPNGNATTSTGNVFFSLADGGIIKAQSVTYSGAFTNNAAVYKYQVSGLGILDSGNSLASIPGALTQFTAGGGVTDQSGVLSVATSKTLTVNNSLTLAGTDATTMTFPTTSATIARTDAGQTFTGTQAFGALTATTVNSLTITTSTGTLTVTNGKTLSVSNSMTFAAGADSQTWTFPSTSDTVACLATAQTFSAANIFSVAGAASTPAVKLTGAWGTGAGNRPQFLIEPTGATAPTWQTSGVAFGVNAANAFGGTLASFQVNGVEVVKITSGGTVQAIGGSVTTNNNLVANGFLQLGAVNSFISSPATATLQFGLADANPPTAQTFQPQSATGSNIAGANFTILGSRSTGSGTSGDILLQTGGTGAGAAVKNSGVTALTIKGATQAILTAAALGDTGYGYAAPVTGGTVTLGAGVYHQIIDPAGTLATLTINMTASPFDGQYVDVKISQVVTALTVSGNGNSIVGNPTSAAVGSSFTAIYRAANTTWYV